MKDFVLKIIVKYVRKVLAYPIGLVYLAYYAILHLVSPKARAQYAINWLRWNNIKTLNDLRDYFRESYKYKYDGYKGLLDHHNFALEFFTAGGDCDDVANYACKKLRELGFTASVYWIYGNGCFNWHFDVMYYDKNPQFFNYGRVSPALPKMYASIYGWQTHVSG